MKNTVLQQLERITTVVIDSSDLASIERFIPLDATTNPSLITAAAQQSSNLELIDQAYTQAKQQGYQADALIERSLDILTVAFGVEILKIIQGRVSTEVDANLSYDTQATIDKGLELIELYKSYGIASDRVLIKIAATWQGIQAAKFLEQQGIHTNLTLLFNQTQAQACANAEVTLISPFVGRILDWYKKHEQVDHYPIEQDPGVNSVRGIYHLYKSHAIKTQVMAASFRSTAQIIALAGCDLLTIAPNLLAELAQDQHTLVRALDPSQIVVTQQPLTTLNEAQFEQAMQQDAMASELLQSGIHGFIQARQQLKQILQQRLVADPVS